MTNFILDDGVNFEYDDEVALEVALDLIEQGYWRPWSDRNRQ
jgi:hypothetical protein